MAVILAMQKMAIWTSFHPPTNHRDRPPRIVPSTGKAQGHSHESVNNLQFTRRWNWNPNGDETVIKNRCTPDWTEWDKWQTQCSRDPLDCEIWRRMNRLPESCHILMLVCLHNGTRTCCDVATVNHTYCSGQKLNHTPCCDRRLVVRPLGTIWCHF